ncbi:MAG: dihydropteroate synthase [Euryarchaeota archaeon]|nr:dihydropteroate synthase [Euryarchaeota archaeon]
MARVRRYHSWDDALAEWRRYGLPETFIDRKRMAGTVTVIEDDISQDEAAGLVSSINAKGGEAYLCRKSKRPKVLINAQPHFYERLSMMGDQNEFTIRIVEAIGNYNSEHTPSLPLGQGELRFDRPLVMGILNVTPDSFSDGGEDLDADKAVERFREMVAEGADIIDIGAESTRPGSHPVTEEEELSRLRPVLQKVASSKIPISIDTRHASVAESALHMGGSIINDVSGLRDDAMIEVIARHQCPVVAMHMKGEPRTMQEDLHYDDLIGDIYSDLSIMLARAESKGIRKEMVVLDPGIGFGKGTEQNLEIIRRFREFRGLGRPLLLGTSRKAFIGAIAGGGPKERTSGSIASAVVGVMNGANIVRVHDVAETVRALKVAEAIMTPNLRPY